MRKKGENLPLVPQLLPKQRTNDAQKCWILFQTLKGRVLYPSVQVQTPYSYPTLPSNTFNQ